MRLVTLDLPFVHEISHVPARARNPRQVIVSSVAGFEVPSVGSDEAPVSVRWERTEGAKRRFPVDRREVSLRTFEGRTYLPLGFVEPVVVAEFVRDCAEARPDDTRPRRRWAAFDLPVQEASIHDSINGRPRQNPMSYERAKDVLVGGRLRWSRADERKAEAARRWRKGLLVVDGHVWSGKEGLFPHYLVGVRDEYENPEANFVDVELALKPHVDYAWSNDVRVPFRADRRDEAVAFARVLASERGLAVRDLGDAFEVVDSKAIPGDTPSMLAKVVTGRCVLLRRLLGADVPPSVVELLDTIQRLNLSPGDDEEWAEAAFAAYVELRRSMVVDQPGMGGYLDRIGLPLKWWDGVGRAAEPEFRDWVNGYEDTGALLGI